MDEYITKNNAISAVCFGCNQEFSDEPCEPSQCAIRQSIMALPTADVVPKSEYDAVVSAVDNSTKEFLKLHDDYQEAKREVEEYKHNWQKIHDSYTADCLEHYNKGQQDAAREIFEEIEKYKRSPMPECKPVYVINYSSFAELKKKYIEDKT